MSPFPQRALRAGDRLRQIVPDFGHLIHMPTHLDVLCGQYHDVLVYNQRALTHDLLRRHFALAQLSLPRDEFPNLVESAEDTAEVWLADPNQWWRNTVDLLVFGLERMLELGRTGSRPQDGTS